MTLGSWRGSYPQRGPLPAPASGGGGDGGGGRWHECRGRWGRGRGMAGGRGGRGWRGGRWGGRGGGGLGVVGGRGAAVLLLAAVLRLLGLRGDPTPTAPAPSEAVDSVRTHI